MLTCKEVTTMIGSDIVERSTWRERLGIRMHLMMCRHCSRYVAQIRAISQEAKRIYADLPQVAELERLILKALRRE